MQAPAAVQVKIPKKLKPLFIGPADVRGSYGGRGSAKTRSFATMAAVRGYMFGKAGLRGIILCARQYMNSLADSSLEEVKRSIEDEPFLSEYYEVGEKFIRSRDGAIEFAFAGLDRSIDSVKSKGRILLCWVDEAEPVTASAWSILIPTLREEGADWNAELWVTWNPKRKEAAVEKRFRLSKDALIRMVEMNWRDNPRFPAKLERERQRDLRERPDQYDHIWEGAYVTVVEGAYYATCLTAARAAGRVGRVAADPLLTHRLFCDIGGTGARADAFTIWDMQFVGREIRALDYYEAVGQPIGAHLEWMRKRGLTPQRAQIWLPHDGETNDRVFDVSYESAFKTAGYEVTVVPNQGKGAAKQRIEAARRHFPAIWFNSPPDVTYTDGLPDVPTVAAGLEALGWYHEKKDEERQIGLGPEHDWSSHGADSFGLACVSAEQIFNESKKSMSDPFRSFRRAG
jgi:phage terminase large subunit